MSKALKGIAAGAVVALITWALQNRQQARQEGAQDGERVIVASGAGQGGQKGPDGLSRFATVLGAVLDLSQAPDAPVAASIPATRPAATGISAILDVIGQAEAPGGYDTIYGGARIDPPRRISTMTVGAVRAFQDQMVASGSVSSAVGRYQIIRKTMDSLIDAGALSPGEVFDQEAQDRAARALMNRRGLDRFTSGQISAETFANNLAKEWAGLPVVTAINGKRPGQSYYDGHAGNSATTSISNILGAIAQTTEV